MIQKRGRKSSAELSTPKVLELHPRQPPPKELKGEERELFADIVKSEAADWFSLSSTPLLVQFVRHTIAARRIAEMLATCDPEVDLKHYARLLAAQRGESSVLVSLGTRLRLTPQATRNHRGNTRRVGLHPWEPRPHEVGSRPKDDAG